MRKSVANDDAYTWSLKPGLKEALRAIVQTACGHELDEAGAALGASRCMREEACDDGVVRTLYADDESHRAHLLGLLV